MSFNLKAYAGSAPVTKASGRSTSITRRRVKNDRLNAVGFLWAFAAIPRPGPARKHYDRRRAHGDRHAAALRHLFNRLLGQLYFCLQTGQLHDPVKAFGEPLQPQTALRLDFSTGSEVYGRGKDQHMMVPGWPYSVIVALESGRGSWTAPLDVVRLAPGDNARA